MLCDICNKKDATVHLTEIIDDQITELHLCEECARAKGHQMEQHFNLGDLLAGLADLGKEIGVQDKKAIKCANCGMAYVDFKKIGRLGCSECYHTFRASLEKLLKRIHGSLQHSGQAPKKFAAVQTKKRSKLQTLKEKLKAVIAAEEFEEAAKLRDQIRKLEKKGKK